MKIRLAYGKIGLDLSVPDAWNVTVIEPRFVPGLPDPRAALASALRAPIQSPPLREWVKATDRVGLVFSDITRPTPNHLILPIVLAELAHMPRENITLFDALGTHRPNTEAELRGMLGDELVDDYRIVQNNAFDQNTQVCRGTSSRGHEIWLNRELVECDVRILPVLSSHTFSPDSREVARPSCRGWQGNPLSSAITTRG